MRNKIEHDGGQARLGQEDTRLQSTQPAGRRQAWGAFRLWGLYISHGPIFSIGLNSKHRTKLFPGALYTSCMPVPEGQVCNLLPAEPCL